MKHFLKRVILFIEEPIVLASCILLIEKCNDAGIGVEIFTVQELNEQIGIYREQALFISDNPDCIRVCIEKGYPVLLYYHEGNRQLTFPKCKYAMENPQDIEAEYLERVFRRYVGLPWDILETKRCRLRETTVGDVETFWSIYEKPGITAYTEGLYPSIEEEKEYIRAYAENMYHFYEFGVWTVLRKGSDAILGRAGLSVRDGYDVPELGYVIGTEYQRQGYAYEVCKEIMKYAKDYLGYEQVGAVVHQENMASVALLKKLGFIYRKAHDEQRDYYIYG